MLDQEILDDFSQQISEQSEIVKSALDVIKTDLTSSKSFEECGQVADRLYGAIAMFGFPEITEYSLKMKEMSYKCSNTEPDSEMVREKCMKLIESYFSYCSLFMDVLSNGDESARINREISLEAKKVDKVLKSYLHNVSGGSTGYDDVRTYIYVYDKLGVVEDNYKRLNKQIFPEPKFYNAYAGLKKAIKESDGEIAGFILDMQSDSWELALKEIREENPLIPIFVTGKNKRILSTVDKKKLKVHGAFLSHANYSKYPAEIEKIEQRAKLAEAAKEAEEEAVSKRREADETVLGNQYTKIAIDVFKTGLPSPFDVYIKLGEEKHVLILKKGEGFDPEQVKKHSEKNVTDYYIDKEDFDEYFSTLDQEIKKILDDPNLSVREKQSVALDYADNVLFLLEDRGVDEKSLGSAKEFVEMSEKIITEVASGSDLVKDFLSDLLNMERGANLAMLSGLFLSKMKASSEIHQDISLICFLHDIALMDAPEHVKAGDLEAMSEEEKELFMAHPKKGAQTLAEVGMKPALLEAVMQHHVRIDNSGFPKLAKDQTINSIAELIGMCDDFLKVLQECEESGEDPVSTFKSQIDGRFSQKLIDVFSLTFS